ncbi:MAG: hypothetical protein QOF19_710 [Alphaproteobacteria bacterium]|jgi:predicted glycoside hydrolase/deacetylase ChbG (UPF0249 family)|nr:hypothetical protein [Alphaproteobacteria bacterium]
MSRADNAAPTRHIWLCADDYGIAPGVNSAIRELIARGRLNATSVMVAAPSFNSAEVAALTALHSDERMAIGLHVTLTAPFQPLSLNYEPLRGGAFLPLGATLRAAFLRQLYRKRLAAEIAAQIEAFVTAFGRAPDFIDGHQHVQLFPQVRDAFLSIVKDAAPNAWVRQCGRVTPLSRRLAEPKALLLDVLSHSFRRRARAHGLRTNPAFGGAYDFRAHPDVAALFPTFLDGLPAEGVVMCHPGIVDDELTRLDPLTTQREKEYAYFASDAFPAALAAKGVALA